MNRFINNNDGTITDTQTGLIWQKDIVGKMTYYEAIKYCNDLSLAGHNNWRLPTLEELHTLVNYLYYDPATEFPDTKSSAYWSSTTGAVASALAWCVGFLYGYVSYGDKSSSYYVRAVCCKKV